MCSKGNGLLAYDVGVGKTATGIMAVMYQLQHEKCIRPLIIVPKAVYSKWVHDIHEFFPTITLNELENLNKDVIDRMRMNSIFEDANDSLLLPVNTVSICTAEAMEKIYFKPESEPLLEKSFEYILSKKKQMDYFTPSKKLSNEQYVFFEELGTDLLLVDEGYTSFGITGEIALSIMPDVFYDLDAPIMRVCSPDVPVPFSPALEKLIIPDENRIREAIRKML